MKVLNDGECTKVYELKTGLDKRKFIIYNPGKQDVLKKQIEDRLKFFRNLKGDEPKKDFIERLRKHNKINQFMFAIREAYDEMSKE